MAEAMRIRATLQGDVADVRVAIVHPMETGLRKTEKGDVVPAHFITHMTATHNGRTVLDASESDAWAARERAQAGLATLEESQKRMLNAHTYPVGLEYGLFERRRDLVVKLRGIA